MNKLINPFRYIAGLESLFLGLGILISTALTAYLSHIHFPDLISVKTSPGFPFSLILIQCLSNWMISSTLFYIVGILLSKSSVRAVDVFGTQAMARFPYLLVAFAGFSPLLDKFGKYMLWSTLSMGGPVVMPSFEMTFAVLIVMLTLIATAWMIILMVNAFKVSTNLKDAKLIVSFIAVLLLATLLTGLLSSTLIKNHV